MQITCLKVWCRKMKRNDIAICTVASNISSYHIYVHVDIYIQATGL